MKTLNGIEFRIETYEDGSQGYECNQVKYDNTMMIFYTENNSIEEMCNYAYQEGIYETIPDMLKELDSYEYVYYQGELHIYFDESDFLSTFKYLYDCSPQSVEHFTIDSDRIDVTIHKTVINTNKIPLPVARLTYTDAFSQDLSQLISYISEYLSCEICNTYIDSFKLA